MVRQARGEAVTLEELEAVRVRVDHKRLSPARWRWRPVTLTSHPADWNRATLEDAYGKRGSPVKTTWRSSLALTTTPTETTP